MSIKTVRSVWQTIGLALVGLLVSQALLAASGAGRLPAALAQPTPELSVEEATIALLPFQLRDDELPSGYTVVGTRAYSNEAQAFENAAPPDPDPRPAGVLLQPLVQSGRVVLVRQFLENLDDPDVAELRYSVALFGTPEGARGALQDPSLLTQVLPDERLSPATAPSIGDEAARYRTSDSEEDSDRLIWRRGNAVFTLASFGPEAVVSAAAPVVTDLATRADRRFSTLPAVATIGTAPTYMPDVTRRLDLYQALLDRSLPDEAFPDTELSETRAISNAILLFDTTAVDPPLIETSVVQERLIRAERRILGVSRAFESTGDQANPPETYFPTYAAGFHLYADAAGAAEAMIATPAEVALRVGNEFNMAVTVALADTTPTIGLGEQARAMSGRHVFDDDVEVEVVTLRWRRGAVELFVDVAVAPGIDVSATVRRLAEQLDARYVANPLPGF